MNVPRLDSIKAQPLAQSLTTMQHTSTNIIRGIHHFVLRFRNKTTCFPLLQVVETVKKSLVSEACGSFSQFHPIYILEFDYVYKII